MILYELIPHQWWNECCDMLRGFFGVQEYVHTPPETPCLQSVRQVVSWDGEWRSEIWLQGQYNSHRVDTLPKPEHDTVRMRKRFVKLALFHALHDATGIRPPWGSLTGIRPTKLAYEFLQNGKMAYMREQCEKLAVRADKIRLLEDIVTAQRGVWENTKENDIGVYAGIPFCPTRCLYCTFPAEDLRRKQRLVEPYLQALLREIEEAGIFAREKDWNAASLYIGGGTPVSLEPPQMKRLLDTLRNIFGHGRELTVEAGRPDRITPEMLRVFSDCGVNRISINPQTMNDVTLQRIGRAHTAASVEEAMERVRETLPDAVVNMDIIVGLPGEDEAMLRHTLERVAVLKPQNLTVHTLAIKRAARIHKEGMSQLPSHEAAEVMLEMAQKAAADMGMRPYYMYRQKYMMGNQENVGYALPGRESIYNIHMMEERQSIIATGAGAISKWVFENTHFLARCSNPKGVEQYIAGLDHVIQNKAQTYDAASEVDGHID